MVSELSPFRPGYNQRPLVLAGRDDALAAADEALAVAALEKRTPAALLVVGPRGTGKTVLLGEIADRAGTTYGWPRLHVEINPGAPFTPAVAAAAAKLVAAFEKDEPKGRFRATSAVVGASLPGVHGEVTLSRTDSSAVGGGQAIGEALAAAVDAAGARERVPHHPR
ncbi:MAG: ATP-binding protein [Actinomycetota bacterium]|nr:ATP-binding protein [Actinomycetota bacterium]